MASLADGNKAVAKAPSWPLVSGDVVALSHAGQYLIVQAHEGASRAAYDVPGAEGEPVFDFVKGPATMGPVPADAAAHLLVTVQGEWIGFRSGLAQGRMLQARKRGPCKLGFFSSNFGTYEQWKVVESCVDEDDENTSSNSNAVQSKGTDWQSATIKLVNRRLDNFELPLHVRRVPATLQVQPPPGDLRHVQPLSDQPTALKAMSGVLLKEWAAFVLKEVRARQEVERRLLEAKAEFEAIRLWLAGECKSMRHEHEAQVSQILSDSKKHQQLAAAAAQQTLSAARGERAARASVMDRILHRHSELKTMGRVWRTWSEAVQDKQLCEAERGLSLERLQRKYFGAWWSVVRCVSEQAIVTVFVMEACFDRWKAAGTRSLQCKRLLTRHLLSCRLALLQRAFLEWIANTCQARLQRAAVSRFEQKQHQKQLGQLVASWRNWAMVESHEEGAKLQAIRDSRNAKQLGKAFTAWLFTCEEAYRVKCLQARADTACKRYQRRYLQSIFRAWLRITEQLGYAREVLDVLARKWTTDATRLLFHEWRDLGTWLRYCRVVIARASKKRNRSAMRLGLRAFSENSTNESQARENSSMQEVRLHYKIVAIDARYKLRLGYAVIRGWRRQADVMMKLRGFATVLGKRVRKWHLALAFDTWAQTVQGITADRDAKLWADHISKRNISARALLAWSTAMKRLKAKKKMLARALEHCARYKTCSMFRGYRDAVCRARQLTKSVGLLTSRRKCLRLRNAWDGWFDIALRTRRLRTIERNIQGRKRLQTMRQWFDEWYWFVSDKQESRSTIHVKVCSRIKGSRIAAVFYSWYNKSVDSKEKALRVDLARKKLAASNARFRLSLCFSKWLDYMMWRESMMRRIKKVKRRARTIFLSLSFERWSLFIRSEAARRDQLRLCLSRKRVALRWFLSWYWEAYDSEIKDSLSILFGTCDQALVDPSKPGFPLCTGDSPLS